MESCFYYRTINALWELYPTIDRQRFFSAAQREWLAKFKGNEEAISALLEQVECTLPSSSAGRKLRPSFFAEWPAGRSSAADASAAGSSATTDDDETEAVTSTVGATTPLVLFCESMGVDPSSFLTAEVTGKAGVITALTSFSNFGMARVCQC